MIAANVVAISMGLRAHVRNARNTFVGSPVGATVGMLICLVVSRWRPTFRHFFDALLALALVASFLSKYCAAKVACDVDSLLWS